MGCEILKPNNYLQDSVAEELDGIYNGNRLYIFSRENMNPSAMLPNIDFNRLIFQNAKQADEFIETIKNMVNDYENLLDN